VLTGARLRRGGPRREQGGKSAAALAHWTSAPGRV